MDLEIVTCNNFIKLRGEINKNNVEIFQNNLQNALKKFNELTISIEGLKTVDRFGVNALADLHVKSIEENKQLYIVGLGCKELYDHFKSQEIAAA